MIQWPPHSKITCFNSSGEVIAESKRSRLDLADALMLWQESHIAYDLEFDACKVKIERVGKPGKTLCNKPFQWNLEIAADYDDEEPEQNLVRRYSGSRFKTARSDASVKTIQAAIDRVFGLPYGCVCWAPITKKQNPHPL